MDNELDPRELARLKKAARAARIRRIRGRVAVFGTSLVALFSGAVLVRSQIDQQQNPFPGATTTASATTSPLPIIRNPADDNESDDGEGSISRIVQTATNTVGDVLSGVQTQSSAPAQSAPTPAPLTTSQS